MFRNKKLQFKTQKMIIWKNGNQSNADMLVICRVASHIN